jgi:putative DNA methylase
VAETYRKKLIEVALPLDAINAASAREKSIRHGHPSTLHLWWARRPLATARAVLFAQLVDDPSAWPERFPTEREQERERQRLFGIIESLVPWATSNDERVLNTARLEIAQSWARSHPSPSASAVLAEGVAAATVNEYLATALPPVHDPFAGGGTIPLEAHRLGLRAIATDLNPIPVLINKALIEIPPLFSGKPAVNSNARRQIEAGWTRGVQGLVSDVRHYGAWIRDEARRRIGHLYPDTPTGRDSGGGKVIAWLWARTVPSPDPAAQGADVPLVSSFWLAQKKGKEAWIEPIVDRTTMTYRFVVQTGTPPRRDVVGAGTKTGQGAFRCLFTGQPIEPEYIRACGQRGVLRTRMMAVVTLGHRSRSYVSPTLDDERLATVPPPVTAPDTALPEAALGFRVQNYGIRRHADLFTSRQLHAMTTFAALVDEVRDVIKQDAGSSLGDDERSLEAGGSGAAAYADAVACYLTCALGRLADFSSTLCVWSPAPKNEVVMHVFGRQTLSMTWDFAEVNPFSDSSGNWLGAVEWVAKAIEHVPANVRVPGIARQASATDPSTLRLAGEPPCVSTDPPYFDNVPYADLSDYFYIWARQALRRALPLLFGTVLVPKAQELIAEPHRHGGREAAEQFFLAGMRQAIVGIAEGSHPDTATSIYYAFKQTEGTDGSSTGWEAFLQAVLDGGLSIAGTWPVRTERPGRLRDTGSNALASSIVLVCERRGAREQSTRAELRRELRSELPTVLAALQHAHIAPVDVAQAAIGPGMAVFSRYAQVVEADGSPMPVRAALHLINEVLDEYLAASEGDFDSDTRWAITWFEQHQYASGAYGDAETLAKARNVSVSGIAHAGIIKSAAGKVRILKREELRPLDYDPAKDERPTVWEYTQHLIRNLEQEGEAAAAGLLKLLGAEADTARSLAYRLYSVCERRRWAEEALAYNGLVIAWPELEKIAAGRRVEKTQTALDLDEDD